LDQSLKIVKEEVKNLCERYKIVLRISQWTSTNSFDNLRTMFLANSTNFSRSESANETRNRFSTNYSSGHAVCISDHLLNNFGQNSILSPLKIARKIKIKRNLFHGDYLPTERFLWTQRKKF